MSVVGNALNAGKESGKNLAKKAGKKAVKKGAKLAAKAVIGSNPLALKIKLIAIAAGLAIILIVILASMLYVLKEKASKEIQQFFAEMFPDTSSGTVYAADGTIVEAATYVHKILEDNGYTYANNNSCLTVEDSQAQGMTTCDCSTYVDWVLNRVGLDMQTRLCGDGMKAELESYDWITPVTRETAEAGDLVLFSGHIQIYGGQDNGVDIWFNAGSTEAIQTPAPSTRGTSFDNGDLLGVYRVSATK